MSQSQRRQIVYSVRSGIRLRRGDSAILGETYRSHGFSEDVETFTQQALAIHRPAIEAGRDAVAAKQAMEPDPNMVWGDWVA